jgi:hypothetical protein
MKNRGPLDLAKLQGVYGTNIHRFEAKEGGEPSIWSHWDRLIHT